jgi:hypothetical protein
MQICPYVTSGQQKYRVFHDMLASRAMGIAVLDYWHFEKLHTVSESFHKISFSIYVYPSGTECFHNRVILHDVKDRNHAEWISARFTSFSAGKSF